MSAAKDEAEQIRDEVPEIKYGRDRTNARLAAVQALYQMDLAQTDLSDVIAEFRNFRLGVHAKESDVAGGDPDFFVRLMRGVLARQREIDPLVNSKLAEGWRLDRLDSTIRAILRSGVFELLELDDVPGRVIINEYVNVAHAFFDDGEHRVVNGVLDKLARQLREDEFAAKPAVQS